VGWIVFEIIESGNIKIGDEEMKTGTRIAAMVLMVVTTAAVAWGASLDGDEIVGTGHWFVSPSPSTNTVGPGVEFTANAFESDFSNNSFRVTYTGGSAFSRASGLITFSDLDFTPYSLITGITAFASSGAGCPVISNEVNYTADSVSIINAGTWDPGAWCSFNIGTVAVPVATPGASLVGDEITGTGNWQVSPSPDTATVVDPGVEFTSTWFDTDFGISSVLAKLMVGSQSFGGGSITFSDLDFTPATAIIGITNFVAHNSPVTLGDVSFTSNSVTIANNGSHPQGTWYRFDIVTDAPPPAPEGGGLAVKTVVLEVTNSVGSIQWQSSTNSSIWHDVTGATGTELDITALYTNTPWFRVETTSGTNAPAHSDTMQVTSYTVPSGTVIMIR